MRLFWKIYLAVFTSFVAVVGVISYGTSARQIADAESRIVNEHKMIGSFVVGDIERRRTESSWPFENLRRLSQYQDFLFWWIVEKDGTIRLADKASFIGSSASRYFSEVTSDTTPEGRVFLNRQKKYGLFVESFGPGDHPSSFWLGFSTEEVSVAARKIVLSVTAFSALALAVLACALYLTIEHFTKPIKVLAEGAAIVGSGGLGHRVPVKSHDELGRLAHAFNQMAEHLETTTTSIDHLNREIAERERIGNELRLSEERFRMLFEYAPDAYYLHDLQDRLIDANRTAERLTGYRKDELIGHTLLDSGILSSAEIPKALTLLSQNASGLPTGPEEFTLNCRDGSQITVEITTVPVTIKGDPVVLGIAHDVTERRKTEEELRRSEERFRQVAESAGEFIWEVDGEGLYTYASPIVEEILGYPPQDIVGTKHFYDFFLPEVRDGLKTMALAAFARAAPFRGFVNSNVHKDGHVVVLETSGVPVVDPQGHLLGYRGADNDITARVLGEEKLRQQTELLKNVISHIPHFVFWKDRNSAYLGCNEIFAKSAGLESPDDIIGKTDYDLVWKENADSYRQYDRQIMESGQPLLNFDEPQTRKDHSQITLLTSKVPLRDASGNVVGILGIYADITERKRAEDRLRESEVRFRSLVEQAGDGFGLLDAEGRYVDVNGATCRLSGYSRDELLRLSIADVAPLVSREEYAARFQALVGQPPITFESTYRRKDGTTFPVEVTVSVIQVGGVPLALSLARDITERKQAERQQAELLQKLSEINQELKDFAHIVSHDLKAPLRAIRVIADWLHADYTDKLDDQGKEYLTLLTSRVDRMQGLIDGVLQYSRIGRTEEGTAPVDLGQVVPEIIENLGVPAHISIRVTSGLPTVEGDATRITQVFQNLLSNAIKYMDKPQGDVAVGCVAEDGFWKFSVRDNGPGIEQKHFDRVFKLFQTLAPRDSSESTGVGLTITKKIVERYGGKIWIESEVGQGSTFFFTLPVRRTEVDHAVQGTDDHGVQPRGGPETLRSPVPAPADIRPAENGDAAGRD